MSSVDGLELPLAWVTAQVNNAAFDISADQLNLTANRTLSISGTTIDWKTVLHKNAADPVDDQDLSTKKYVDDNLPLAGHIIEDEAVPLPQQPDLNFTGDLVTATDNVGNTATDVKIATGFSAKGDLLTQDGTDPIPLPVGIDGQRLEADSAELTGLKWVTPSPTGSPLTTKGDLYGFSTVDARIPIGADGQVLTANAAQALGLEWAAPAQTGHTIQNDGSDLAQRINLNFVGALVLATDGGAGPDSTIVTIDGALNDLTDVNIPSPSINEVLNFNGSLWVSSILGKSSLPASIAYKDETNVFTLQNTFNGGILMGSNIDMNMNFDILNMNTSVYNELAGDPPDPVLTQATFYLEDGSDFGSPDPIWATLIDRGGVITKKPFVTSETVFALRNFSNGMFVQETGTRLVDPAIADTMRVQLFREADPGASFEVVLDGLLFTIASPDVSVTVGNSINIPTSTTANVPLKSFVWIRNISGTATMEFGTDFPTSTDFAVVGTFILQDKTSVLADGPLAVNSPDYEIFDESDRGHLAHINDRLVSLDSTYISGIDLTVTPTVGGGTAANVTYISGVGESFELHREDIEAFDVTTGFAVVTNDSGLTDTIIPVNDIGLDLIGLTCANGTTVIGNNDNINVVLWTTHVDSEPNQTNYGINLPFDTYTGGGADQNAIDDISGYAIKNIPLPQRGVALLIAEVVIKITGGGLTFEVLSIKDLRGQIPGAASSGGSGGGGATQLNDLTDVTIAGAALNQILINDGGGQWVNQDNPAGLLAGQNVWTDFQDFTEITIPADPATTVGRFYLKRLNVNNVGLFIKMQQAGAITEVQIA